MKEQHGGSAGAYALQVTLSFVLLSLFATLFAFLFAAAPSGNPEPAFPGVSLTQISTAISGPSCPDDSWRATNTSGAPTARAQHTAVWTGSEMIVWGGGSNTGGRYNPITDSWTPTSSANAPSARADHTAVWTGSEMIVWGGRFGSSSNTLNTGGRYNPLANSWTSTSTVNAPSARSNHVAVWTGSEMIVWGGDSGVGCCPGGCCALNTGAKYNPMTNSWTPVNMTGAPTARSLFEAVWTGTEMIVWGGGGGGNTGGRYNPTTDSWTPTSTINAPTGRLQHTAVWTGSEMIVWGGAYLNTGGRYSPATDSWTPTSTINVPAARTDQTAVWTGSEMIVWGGYNPSGVPHVFKTGGRYNPSNDSWRPTDPVTSPNARFSHTAVWNGNEMIVWGGYEDDGMVTPTSAPGPQTTQHPVVIDGSFPIATGGRYCAQPVGLTVSLPIDTLDNQAPIDTVFLKPVTTSDIDASLTYIGFQGDFTFDETVVTFSPPFVEAAGLTGTGWNVSANLLTGAPGIRTLRVSAFSKDGITPLSGSGTLYNLKMLRVSSERGRSTPLAWRPAPDGFIFIDNNLTKIAPNQTNGFIAITGPGPTATPTPTPTPTATPLGCATFSNPTTITIPASGSSGVAAPYPSNIAVSGLVGTISHMSISLSSITHAHPKDIDVLLVGPGGQNATIMSDAAGYGAISGIFLDLDDATFVYGAFRSLPNGGPVSTGTYRPANYADCDEGATDTFPAPAPAPAGGSALSAFNGTNPNGTWSLYVVDDKEGNTGSFSGGWAMTIVTTCPTPTPTSTPPPAPSPTFFSVVTPASANAGSPFSFTVIALDQWGASIAYSGTVHFTSSDIDAVLPVDSGLSGATGTFTAILNQTSTSQTITATDTNSNFLTGTSNCISVGPTPSPTPTPTPPARPLNLSTRLNVETGNNVGIGGFIITGTAPRQVLLRGIGPSFVGVGEPLADPVLELHGTGGFVTITNNNWRETQEAEIIATGIPPPNDLEAAILAKLDPGAYTAILTGNNDGTGVGLVEIYDLSAGSSSKLANISTRALVGAGNDIVIAGFILGGGSSDDVILVRGLGPSLTQSGVPNPLANPTLELRNGDGAVIASNDDWQNGPPVSLPPSDPLESALEMTLSPGAYTALLSGVNSGTGVGLVEVYDRGLPP